MITLLQQLMPDLRITGSAPLEQAVLQQGCHWAEVDRHGATDQYQNPVQISYRIASEAKVFLENFSDLQLAEHDFLNPDQQTVIKIIVYLCDFDTPQAATRETPPSVFKPYYEEIRRCHVPMAGLSELPFTAEKLDQARKRIRGTFATERSLSNQAQQIESPGDKQIESPRDKQIESPRDKQIESPRVKQSGGLRTEGLTKQQHPGSPLVSILTVTFNDAKGLERTIQSVLAQDASNVELIIVDGGSTDGSVEILKKYQTYIDYWLSEADNGIYDAMNKAVRLAQGQGMLFLNAGDFMFGALDFNRHPAPTFFPVIYLNAFNKLLNIAIKSYDQGLPSCHQGILFENHQRQFDIRYKLAADYDYYLQQGYRQLPLANSKGYIYYDNQGSSKQQARLRDQEIYQIIRLNFGWLKAQQFAFKVFGKNLVAKVLGL